MSSTGTVRSRGELLCAVAVRLAMVCGLAVAAWLAGAVTAYAAQVSVRAGDPSPSAVLQQGEQPVDALARTDACGSGDCAADNSSDTPAETSAAATDAATLPAWRAPDGESAVPPSLPHPGMTSAVTPIRPAVGEPGSAAGVVRPSGVAGRLPAAPLAARPASQALAAPSLPSVSFLPLVHPFEMPGAFGDRPGDAATRPVDLPAITATMTGLRLPGWPAAAPQRVEPLVTGTLAAEAVAADSCPLAAVPGCLPSQLAVDPTSVAMPPAVSLSDSGHGVATDAQADLRPDFPLTRVTMSAADPAQPWTPRDQPADSAPGSPGLPRPEPEPQPAAPAPPAPSAAPNGHSETGGHRGVLGILPVQLVLASPIEGDAERVGGAILVPGVQEQPTTSPD